jgi:hypothetical protein
MDMLSGVKKGQKLVKILIGGGCETASIVTLEKSDKKNKRVYLEGCDGGYTADSVYAYDMTTGRACSSYIPGFQSRLVYLEDE